MIGGDAGFRRRDRARAGRGGLALTAALGALFLAVQGYEWVRLIGYGPARHVGRLRGDVLHADRSCTPPTCSAALVWLGVALRLARARPFPRRARRVLRACAIYWHFVVALWPILYVAVYLT